MNQEEKIELIMYWAGDHPEFDTTFVESLQGKLDEYGQLTENQEAALDNIITKWKMNEEE